MRKLTFGMNVSLDGYIAAPGDDLGWSVPTADQQPGATPAEVEFARRWRDMPKVVFSSTTRRSTSMPSSPIRFWWGAARRSSRPWTTR